MTMPSPRMNKGVAATTAPRNAMKPPAPMSATPPIWRMSFAVWAGLPRPERPTIQKNRTAAARSRRICGMALLQLLEQEMRLAAALLGKILKRLVPACRIDGNRRQELAQLMRGTLIEAAEGAAC